MTKAIGVQPHSGCLSLSVLTNDAMTCILIEGELETGTALDLDQAIQIELGKGITSILLDLIAADYMSSMGLRVFLSALKAINPLDLSYSSGTHSSG
jgi:anti-anti-sigma factor